MRHLTMHQAVSALGRGHRIEQLLVREQIEDGRWTVRWVTVCPVARGFRISIHHVEDAGTPDFFDVSEFPPIDDKEPVGEGRVVGETESPAEAIDLAAAFGAVSGRWVNQGLIDVEYHDEVSKQV